MGNITYKDKIINWVLTTIFLIVAILLYLLVNPFLSTIVSIVFVIVLYIRLPKYKYGIFFIIIPLILPIIPLLAQGIDDVWNPPELTISLSRIEDSKWDLEKATSHPSLAIYLIEWLDIYLFYEAIPVKDIPFSNQGAYHLNLMNPQFKNSKIKECPTCTHYFIEFRNTGDRDLEDVSLNIFFRENAEIIDYTEKIEINEGKSIFFVGKYFFSIASLKIGETQKVIFRTKNKNLPEINCEEKFCKRIMRDFLVTSIDKSKIEEGYTFNIGNNPINLPKQQIFSEPKFYKLDIENLKFKDMDATFKQPAN